MKRRLRAGLALLLSVVAATTACGSPEPACGADGTGPITFATVKDLTADQRDHLTAAWAQKHPGQDLYIVELPATADEQRAQLAATLRVGEQAGSIRDRYDVVGLDVVFLAEFARRGFLQSLSEQRFRKARFLPAPWTASRYRGRLYAVPFTTNVGLLYYWADRLVELGLISEASTRWRPADWQTIRNAARDSRDAQLAGEPGPAGYTGQLDAYEGLTANALELIWAEGGDLPTPERPATPKELKNAARGVEFLLEGVRNKWIDKSALGFGEQESLNAFAAREALFLRHWPDAWPALADAKFPIEGTRLPGEGSAVLGVTRLPGEGSAVLGGESLAVARCSPYRETAREFIEFLTDSAQQKWFFEIGLYLPAVEHLYTDDSLTAGGGLPDYFVQLLHESVLDARGRPADPAWTETSRTIQTALHAALQRSATTTVNAEDLITDLAEDLG